MQFKVPQFLEIEDKIFGPFTFREFIYLAGGAGLCFILYRILGLFLGAIPILFVAGFALALTFYRPNNKPFVDMLEAGFKYFSQSKLYVWKRGRENQNKINTEQQNAGANGGTMTNRGNTVKLGGNKLRDLAWSLDVLDVNKHIEDK